ncbi:MAG TPA: hypothetical protein VMU51_09070 [Mycobacteriales bacterium]|nr:hypothetical protein [Mycobacteriales bacterium]
MADRVLRAHRAGPATAPAQVERVTALSGSAEIGRAEIGQWAELGEAAYRLRIAQAVLDQLTVPGADPAVTALAYEELHLAEQRYLGLSGRSAG